METTEEQNSQEVSSQGLFKLNVLQLGEIIKLGIPLEGVYIIESLIEGTDPRKHIPSLKIEGIYQLLQRKGYLSSKCEVTNQGKELHDKLILGARDVANMIGERKEQQVSSFNEWWACFPPSNGFEYNGKTFPRTRAIRTAREQCEQLFTNIVNTSQYTGEQIIEATKAHIDTMKRNSVKEGKNNLTYLQNSATYLRNRVFEAFMGEKSSGSTEILPTKQEFNI